MKRPLLALTILLGAPPASAQRAAGLRCPQGAEPKFTGAPFKPLVCVAVSSAAAAAAAEPPAPPMPLKGAGLKDLEGRWEGYVAVGFERFELLLSAEKKGWRGRDFSAQLETKEHRNPLSQILALELKGERAVVRLETAQVAPLKAKVHLGKSADPAYDREMLLVYEDGSAHRLRFKRDKDTLRYSYLDLAHPERPVQGELKRTPRKTL